MNNIIKTLIITISTIIISFSAVGSNKDQFIKRDVNYEDHSNNGRFFEDDVVEGNPSAKVVVVEYFALTCPHCSIFHKNVYPLLKQKYIDTNKIAFIQREFIGNKQDLESAILARCISKEKRKVMYDVLLNQQESWAYNRKFSDILVNLARMSGLSAEKYKECLEDRDLANILMSNSKLIASTPGFVGTPVFVVNNVVHKGDFSLDTLSKVIDNQLMIMEKDEQEQK